MSRSVKRSLQYGIDVVVLSAAYWLAFLARFDGALPLQMWKRLLFTWPYVIGFQLAVMYAFSVPRFVWRYVGLREITSVFLALGTASGALVGVRLLSAAAQEHWGYAQYALVPFGVIGGDFLLAFTGVSGVRIFRRILGERGDAHARRRPKADPVRTLLVGAGSAGVIVAKEIEGRPDLGIRAVAFVDDDPGKLGTIIHGVPVLGATERIAEIAARTRATQVLITMAAASGETYRRIVRLCDEAGLRVKIIPGVFEILDGKVNLSRIRDVSIEDLLGREPVHLDTALLEGFLRGKRVVVTGAGGSIGSELCRQVARFSPASLVLVEQAEFALFSIHHELIASFPEVEIVPRICDVCDARRVERVFEQERPEVVFHAAAHKHVPMMEWNPGEAVKNNVLGTRVVADAAHRHRAGAFVMVSTDKAVNPTSVMGATKRVAEMYVQALSQRSNTKYVAVRFGNVLGSAGSVIPIFKAQIAAGGPVTVTHPEMMRYFMTIPEASQLVMQAAAMGRGGEIFVLDMGAPVKIAELAEELIRLSGLEPHRDIRIEFTGVRPGEKLFEELGFRAERMTKTKHPKIYVGKLAPCDYASVVRHVDALGALGDDKSAATVRRALRVVVPEMQTPDSGSPPEVVPAASGRVTAERAVGGAAIADVASLSKDDRKKGSAVALEPDGAPARVTA